MKKEERKGPIIEFRSKNYIEAKTNFVSNKKARQVLCPTLHIDRRQYKLLLKKLQELGLILEINHKGFSYLRRVWENE